MCTIVYNLQSNDLYCMDLLDQFLRSTKNDLFFNCRTKTKELSKKELSNVTPASFSTDHTLYIGTFDLYKMRFIVCLVLFNVFKQNKSFWRKERMLSFHSSWKKMKRKF